jgi:hypothetical protein
VCMHAEGRQVQWAVILTLDGPFGVVGPKQFCIEDQRQKGTLEEVEVLAWCIAWFYNRATERIQEES